MKKNDITYEYRVFTSRPVDVETLEVGRCASKTIKELKSKDKVDGRFFHTSDTDEWFFCWNGELQKLNLKGDADVNAALEEVNRLITEANIAVEEAKKTAVEAKDAATAAAIAADAATAAVESIGNKADKSYVNELVAQEVAVKADKTAVDALTTTVAGKADTSVVNALSTKVDSKADKSELDEKADKSIVEDLVSNVASKADVGIVNELSQVVATKADADDVQALSDKVDAIKLDGYATESFVGEEIAKIEIPTVPKNVSEFENDAKYLTIDEASSMFAPIDSEGGDMGGYATKKYVDDAIALKQDKIDGLDEIRSGAALGATALQSIPDEYITKTELNGRGYATVSQVEAKQDVITDLDTIRTNANKAANAITAESLNESLDNYYTKGEIDSKIDAINAMLGEAINITNTILA